MTIIDSPRQVAPAEWFTGALMVWHVTSEQSGGAFALGELWVRPGTEPPLHIHAREDETYYVLEGEVTFQLGLDRIEASPGSVVFLPRGIQHGLAVRTPVARLLHLYSPGGIEAAFRSLSQTAPARELPPAPAGPPSEDAVAALTETFGEFGVEFVGPPLPALL
jgi:quercetin dioxygenase-like cupin family protein